MYLIVEEAREIELVQHSERQHVRRRVDDRLEALEAFRRVFRELELDAALAVGLTAVLALRDVPGDIRADSALEIVDESRIVPHRKLK